jgi:hypothetical protein
MRFNRGRWMMLVSAALLSACGSGGGGGTGARPSSATGTLTLGLTDSPVDQVYEVNVQFTGVSVKPETGAALRFDFPAPVDVDLLALQNGSVFDLLDGETVPAGRYSWIELHVNADLDGTFDSFVRETETGGQMELRIPSGEQRFVSGFVVTAAATNAFMLDWDVRKGLTNPSGQGGWILRPAFRLVDRTEYGSLSGSVADALVMDESCTSDAEGNGNLVYVFAGHDVQPDDLGSGNPPLTTAPVRVDSMAAGAYRYTVAYLDPGPYTVAFTCQGIDDDPMVDEMNEEQITFPAQVNAEVIEGAGTDLEAPPIE